MGAPGFAGQNLTAGIWNAGTVQVTTKAGLATLNPVSGMLAWVSDLQVPAFYNTTTAAWDYVAVQAAPTQVLASAAASVTFLNIPAYTSLMIEWHGRCSNAVVSQNLTMQINNDTGAHYTGQALTGSSATANASNYGALSAAGMLIGSIPGSSSTALYFGGGQVGVEGWNNATDYVTVFGTYSAPTSASAGMVGIVGGLYQTAAACTSVTLLPAAGNFVANSRFTIYGKV